MAKYGIPYMGSKDKIADDILSVLPRGKRFVDLFGGGFAMSHAALLSGKYEQVFYNEINPLLPKLIKDTLAGKYANERRWISREDFSRLKDVDDYVRYIWSFGNHGNAYLYGKEIEPWKKALHFARVLKDPSLLQEFGINSDGSAADIKAKHNEYKQKYIVWYMREILKYTDDIEKLRGNIKAQKEELRLWLCSILKKSGKRACDVDKHLGTNGMAGHYFGKNQWAFPTREAYNKLSEILPFGKNYEEVYGYTQLCESLQRLQRLQSLQSLESLQRLQRLQRLQSLQSLQRLEKLEINCGSYLDYQYRDGDVVYCDPPYENTQKYDKDGFNHKQFYEWVASREFPVYFSSYEISDTRFYKIYETEKISLLNNKVGNKGKLRKMEILYSNRPKKEQFGPLFA